MCSPEFKIEAMDDMQSRQGEASQKSRKKQPTGCVEIDEGPRINNTLLRAYNSKGESGFNF